MVLIRLLPEGLGHAASLPRTGWPPYCHRTPSVEGGEQHLLGRKPQAPASRTYLASVLHLEILCYGNVIGHMVFTTGHSFSTGPRLKCGILCWEQLT